MPNSYISTSNTSISTIDPSYTDTSTTPFSAKRTRPSRRRLLAIGSIIALGALASTGYGVQSAMAAQAYDERIAVATDLTTGSDVLPEAEYSYSAVVQKLAEQSAEVAINGANAAVASAQGKTDATALSTSVAALSYFTLLAPERVFQLVDETVTQTATVQAAVLEVDRIAAEQAAAAAAAQAAAEQAAAEAAASASSSAASRQSSGGSRPSAPTDPSGAQAIARDMMASKYGWGADQFGCLVPLWQRESGWNVNAYNSSSGATGIPQALPGNKMATAGADWQTNPATQISWGLGYIADRYGSPCAAWDHSESVGWY
ncbi:MAG TPA: hypothetical protein VEX88_08530 [Glaciibacter sp.]|nr:hypothetical protein [Glaciibacter sp.]